jgi:DNA-binding NtrC family response regulator
MMDGGAFMRDLYDRLSFAVLSLPPLRKRPDDIPVLIEHFIAQLHDEMPDLGRAEFTEAALRDLTAYRWPGNVRELKNVIERLYVFDRDRVIDASELPLEVSSAEPITGTFKEKVQAFEKALLANALKDAAGNQRAAARDLGMSYDQFRHYFKKYGLAGLV